MTPPAVKILALHGKGTNASIFRSQVAAILKAAGIEDSVQFESGPNDSAPYHNIESYFPGQSYRSWYEAPTKAELFRAYDYIAALLKGDPLVRFGDSSLVLPAPAGRLLPEQSFGPRSPCLRSDAEADAQDEEEFLEPRPAFKHLRGMSSSTGTSSAFLSSRSRSGALTPFSVRRVASPIDGMLSPAPSSLRREVLDSSKCFRAYDGVICFSQGCAAVAGMLLQQAMRDDGHEPSIRFAIFICGSRPFDPESSKRYDPADLVTPSGRTARISIPTVHLIGRKDAARKEGYLLASLCDAASAQCIEFDGGHIPPRKSADVQRIARSIRTLIEQCN